MGAPKTPKRNELEYNGRTSNKKDAGQIFFCPRIKGVPFIRYFRVVTFLQKEITFLGGPACKGLFYAQFGHISYIAIDH